MRNAESFSRQCQPKSAPRIDPSLTRSPLRERLSVGPVRYFVGVREIKKVRHLLTLFEISQQELHTILSLSQQIKQLLAAGRRPPWLARRVLAMLFEKPSLRTRVSFEAGILQLGGAAMFLGQEVGWQSREATVILFASCRYADVVVCRAKAHQSVDDLASYNCVPIINGLTDLSHPCQAWPM